MVQILELVSQKDASGQELEDISDCVVNSQRIVVIAGAGISCSGGIPVFFQPLEPAVMRLTILFHRIFAHHWVFTQMEALNQIGKTCLMLVI
jgi:hypothetical protein